MQIINNLPNKNSCGFDGISTIVMKSINNVILKSHTLIINQIINTGLFTNKLKIAKKKMTPIFKVEHRDSKCHFLNKSIFLHRLIIWNVFFKMTHVLPLISAQNCDKNALPNRRDRPVLNKFGSLTAVFSVLSFSQYLPMYSIFAAQYLQKY